MFFRTKKLIVDVIRIQAGENLPEILETPSSGPQVFSCFNSKNTTSTFLCAVCSETFACFNIIY